MYIESKVNFQCRKLHPDAKIPTRKRDTDAGYDVYAVEDTTVFARNTVNVRTGIAIAPPAGYYYTLDGRSGMGKAGITVFRGVIDSGYTGEAMALVHNATDAPFFIKKGDRIAQLVPHECVSLEFEEVDEFSPEYSMRGDNGWGSSGK